MKTYNISITSPNGKSHTVEVAASTPEIVVRIIMNWYSIGTRFDVGGKSFVTALSDDVEV